MDAALASGLELDKTGARIIENLPLAIVAGGSRKIDVTLADGFARLNWSWTTHARESLKSSSISNGGGRSQTGGGIKLPP